MDRLILSSRSIELQCRTEVSRFVGTYPADDDNVYWVRRGSLEVQIDTGEAGAQPFTIEGDRPGSLRRLPTLRSPCGTCSRSCGALTYSFGAADAHDAR